jgi:hypothetical protein
MKKSLVRFGAISVVTSFLLLLPVSYGSGVSILGPTDACAQTGTCKASAGDICFVNGNPYYDRQWESAATRE